MLGILSAEVNGAAAFSILSQSGQRHGPAWSGSNIFHRQTIHRMDVVNRGSSSLPDSAITEIRYLNASKKLLSAVLAHSHGRKAMALFPIHGFAIHGRKPAPCL